MAKDEDSVAKRHQGRDGANVRGPGQLLFGFGVDLSKADVGVLVAGLFVYRSEGLAGATPFGPKVHEGDPVFGDGVFKVCGGQFNRWHYCPFVAPNYTPWGIGVNGLCLARSEQRVCVAWEIRQESRCLVRPVDKVVTGGLIRTMDEKNPEAHWMAIERGRVVAVDSIDEQPPEARQVEDVSGQTVVPGFHDAHCHTMWFGLSLGDVDAAACNSFDELYAALAERASTTPPGQWVRATGYNQALFGGEYPDIDRLDRVLPHHPLFMRHTSGHACIVNSVAMDVVGLESAGEIDGGAVVRDEHGRATGVLEERAQAIVQQHLLPLSNADMAQALGRASERYGREGLTSFTETGIAGGWIGHSPRELAAYQSAKEQGVLAQRAQLMVVSDVLHGLDGHADDPRVLGLDAGIRTGFGDDSLSVGPMKIFLDGSMLAWTGAVSEPFSAGPPDNYGYFQAEEQALRDTMLRASAAGWAVGAHAIGDRAVALALDTFEEALSRFGAPVVPHRIEHGGVVTDEQVAHAARLGVAIVTQPGFMPELGVQMRAAMGPAREGLIHRHRSLLNAGAVATGSSDRPVATGVPLRIIQSMVERLDSEGVVVGPDERVSIEQALWSYTVGSAHATGSAGSRGMLAAGMLADYVVLAADPVATPVEELSTIGISGTVVGGTRVFGEHG